ncbi:hypothetical protein EON62_05000, partial [archaeon]
MQSNTMPGTRLVRCSMTGCMQMRSNSSSRLTMLKQCCAWKRGMGSHDSRVPLSNYVAATHALGLDFLVVTDHNVQDAVARRLKGVTVLSWTELTTAFGHVVGQAFQVHRVLRPVLALAAADLSHPKAKLFQRFGNFVFL